MSRTYRVGLIGHTGRGNYGHAVDMAFVAMPNMEVVAVADADERGRAEAQKRTGAERAYADYQQMLGREKLDIVGICPRWIDQHRDMIIAATEAGCHIYMEKPFCRTLAECDDAVTALQMRHLKLGIAHISQYSPVLDRVDSLIRAGEIGDVLELRGRGKEDRRGGGEDLWVLGSHIFGLMRTLGRGDARSCTAIVRKNDLPVTRADVVEGAEGIGLLAGDDIQARYEFPGSVYGHFASVSNMGGEPSRFAVQVFGSTGIIEIGSGYLAPAWILRDNSWSPGRTGSQWEKITSAGIGEPEPVRDGSYQAGHIAAINDLAEAVENERTTKCSAEDSRAIVEMTAAVFESHRLEGVPVELPLTMRENPLALLT
jgi:predicted dehydrogenase